MKPIIEFEKDVEVVSVVKMGGYYVWSWKFPFIHFREEELIIATKDKIYKELSKRNV